MANKNLFKSIIGKMLPGADARNEAGGPAYAFSPEHALAQYIATGCMNGTFYADAEEQLESVLAFCQTVAPEFIARAAIYARERGFMKDTPALLAAILSVKGPELLQRIFHRVIDNGRMLRNFTQIMRSGVTGRKSLGSLPKRLIREWLASHDDIALFNASVGNAPSLADIIKMVHPKPAAKQREAMLGYLIGKEVDQSLLPEQVRRFEAFKREHTGAAPDVPFLMLTALELSREDWIGIARNASWQTMRMNLNTFARHGVFEDAETVRTIAGRLRDAEAIRKARVFPYQIMTAFLASDERTPHEIREALQDAMETATENVPAVEGKIFVFPDVSGSMSSPVTGFRKGATTAVRCVDVAALMTACILRRNPAARVLPFENDVVNISINPRDSIMTNAKQLASIGGGGTNCSAPLALLNRERAQGDLAIFISDNESWVDAGASRRGTATLQEWQAFKQHNPQARLVCLDIQPYGTTQAAEREDILNIGGFADSVFEVIGEFAAGRLATAHWLEVINQVEI